MRKIRMKITEHISKTRNIKSVNRLEGSVEVQQLMLDSEVRWVTYVWASKYA
jgi:hypothetical protein